MDDDGYSWQATTPWGLARTWLPSWMSQGQLGALGAAVSMRRAESVWRVTESYLNIGLNWMLQGSAHSTSFRSDPNCFRIGVPITQYLGLRPKVSTSCLFIWLELPLSAWNDQALPSLWLEHLQWPKRMGPRHLGRIRLKRPPRGTLVPGAGLLLPLSSEGKISLPCEGTYPQTPPLTWSVDIGRWWIDAAETTASNCAPAWPPVENPEPASTVLPGGHVVTVSLPVDWILPTPDRPAGAWPSGTKVLISGDGLEVPLSAQPVPGPGGWMLVIEYT
jgi:hypothetical protein